jgi:hypothetical protein
MPTIPAKPSFRERLPRLYELKDMIEDAAHPDAYFQNFEDGLAEHKSKLAAFLKLERQLAVLDEAAWADLKGRAAAVLQKREPGRGWRLLFDVFSEARAYGYLVSIGCTGVRFIPRGKRKTPDLAATLAGEPVFCEVKTRRGDASSARVLYEDLQKAKDSGAITDAEYQTQKAKLLGGKQ